jgi:hypothetical protein
MREEMKFQAAEIWDIWSANMKVTTKQRKNNKGKKERREEKKERNIKLNSASELSGG